MKKALTCYLVLLLSPMFLRAQISNNTSLVGTVLDKTGSAVTGAKVTAVEQATKANYSTTTNSEGYYAITFIKPGTMTSPSNNRASRKQQQSGYR